MPRLVIEAAHLDQLREHGGLTGIRDENALEGPLARPRQKWHYEPDTDLASLAAAYAFGLTKSHAFTDGNKRIAFLAAVIFLGLNGHGLAASDVEVVQVMIALADGSLSERQLAQWISGRLERAPL